MPPADRTNARDEPIAAVRELLREAGRQRGVDLENVGLRLFEATSHVSRVAEAGDGSAAVKPISPFDLGRSYELLLAPQARQSKGAHLTPEGVARQLVALMPKPCADDTVLDPAVGGAAFLLAMADRLVEAGASPDKVVHQLIGIDIDPGAVAVAEAAIVLWGVDRGVGPGPLPNIAVGDGLLDDLPQANHVVGNPPFLNQLRKTSSHSADRRAALRSRWGDLVSAYTDDAWLFLAAGLRALVDGGSMAMVQPVSILAARDGDAVRSLVHAQSSLAGLWVARDRVFDAAVHVCGVVVAGPPHRRTPVVRCVGSDFVTVPPLSNQPLPHEWGSAAAATVDVPTVHFPNRASRTVADVATATAGFRDQFYGFVPFVDEATGNVPTSEHPRLVTVGMIDVLGLSWGQREFRFAKRRFVRPVLDRKALRTNDPALADWAEARCRPKLLVATQTRVVEVWVDLDGNAVPATPVVSVEPFEEDPENLWLLAAALTAPALSAHFLASKFGTAMSLNSMKLAARDVLSAPLPTNQGAWREAAELLRGEPASFAEFAVLMGAAYEVNDPALVEWWLVRASDSSKPASSQH